MGLMVLSGCDDDVQTSTMEENVSAKSAAFGHIPVGVYYHNALTVPRLEYKVEWNKRNVFI